MDFIRHIHAALNQIYVYVLSSVVVTESIIILCACGTSFSPLTKRPIDKIALVTHWSDHVYSQYTHIALCAVNSKKREHLYYTCKQKN